MTLSKRVWGFTQPGHFPIALGIAFLVFAFTYRLFELPQPVELAAIARQLYADFGLPILLLASVIEGLFVVGFYLPGSFVIFLSVYLSPKGFLPLALIALTVGIGFLISATINYLVGKYGLYRVLAGLYRQDSLSRIEAWMQSKGDLALPLSAALPNLFAVTTLCMGVARRGLIHTLTRSAIGLLFWMPFWTIISSRLLAEVSLESAGQHWWIFGAFVIWGLWSICVARWRAPAREESSNEGR